MASLNLGDCWRCLADGERIGDEEEDEPMPEEVEMVEMEFLLACASDGESCILLGN